MQARGKSPLFQVGAMLALIVGLAGCTKGGQFDPTTLLDNNMFDTKKPLQGQRQLVFPNGVPGATSGIPAELYKGYQAPPDQAAVNAAAATPAVPPAREAEPPPAAASAKPKAHAARKPHAVIKVGLAKHPKPAALGPAQASQAASPASTQSSDTAWPAPPAAPRSSGTVWPAPPSTSQAQSAQTVWPAPPAASAEQSSQSVWPNPPATGGSTQ
jgi:hypothetical protein